MAAMSWDPVEFFKEEIGVPVTAEVRIYAVKNLYLVASAIGEERTANELIPWLNKEIGCGVSESANKDKDNPLCNDDEFLFCMATQYAVLRSYIKHDNLSILIEPLVHLAQQEETVIRDEAILSLCTIVKERPSDLRQQILFQLKEMAKKTEFTTRVSACALFPTVYKYHQATYESSSGEFKAIRQELCKTYKDICNDDTPMVRRAAAHRMKEFVTVLEQDDLTTGDFLEAYRSLAREETQDTIRTAVVHTSLEMAKRMGAEDKANHTLPVLKQAAEDRSWRVRLTVVKNFDELLQAFGPQITKDDLMPCLKRLLQDAEQEVRKEAVMVIKKCLPPTVKGTPLIDNTELQSLADSGTGLFTQLGSDAAQPVRAALAQIAGPVAKQLGKEFTQRSLLPLISDLMKDEYHDVRLNIVSHAGTLCDVLSVDGLVHSLLHTIQSLIMDNHWRIRRSVVQQVPKLAERFGVEMFQSKLESLFLSSLRDSVFSVRKEAIEQLKAISSSFGAQWTVEHLLPKVMEQYSQSAGYANRVTTLQVLPKLWETVREDSSQSSTIVNLLVKASKDSVPNVRFCACKMIIELLKVSQGKDEKAEIAKKVMPALKELENDSDSDVQYFAQQAMKLCDN